jgi:tRNA U54 and U55 pseudouridine synthase Pus10
VTAQDFLDQETCEVCGDRLVTLDELVAHIYDRLTSA